MQCCHVSVPLDQLPELPHVRVSLAPLSPSTLVDSLYAGSQHRPHALAVRARHRTMRTLQTCRAARSTHKTQVRTTVHTQITTESVRILQCTPVKGHARTATATASMSARKQRAHSLPLHLADMPSPPAPPLLTHALCLQHPAFLHHHSLCTTPSTLRTTNS